MKNFSIITLLLLAVMASAATYEEIREGVKAEINISQFKSYNGPFWGCLIDQVSPGSPASKLGISPGYLFYDMNGFPIPLQDEWTNSRIKKLTKSKYYDLSNEVKGELELPAGKIGISFKWIWLSQIQYIKDVKHDDKIDWDLVVACIAFQNDEYSIFHKAIVRVKDKDNIVYKSLYLMHDVNSGNMENISAEKIIDNIENCEYGIKAKIIESYIKYLLIMGRYSDYLIIKNRYSSIFTYQSDGFNERDYDFTEMIKDEKIIQSIDPAKLRAKITKAFPADSIKTFPWSEDLKNGKRVVVSIPADERVNTSFDSTDTSLRLIISMNDLRDTDQNPSEFGRYMKLGVLPSVDKSLGEKAIPPIQMTVQSDGYFYVKINNKQFGGLHCDIDLSKENKFELIVTEGVWVVLWENNIIAKGCIKLKEGRGLFPSLDCVGITFNMKALFFSSK